VIFEVYANYIQDESSEPQELENHTQCVYIPTQKSYGRYKGRKKPYFVTLVRYENNRYDLQLQYQNVKQLFTPWGNEIQTNR